LEGSKMADIRGYINPRSLGNNEPNKFFGFDIFIAQDLWDNYVAHKRQGIQNTRTWDICWMLRSLCPSPAAIARSGKEGCLFQVSLKNKTMTLRAYIHPQIMALCVAADSGGAS
jgi:hypothetical protein